MGNLDQRVAEALAEITRLKAVEVAARKLWESSDEAPLRFDNANQAEAWDDLCVAFGEPEWRD